LTGAAFGAPLMTTSGGAGEVLSATGDLLGARGAPRPPFPGEGLLPSVALEFWFNGDPPDVRSIGEAAAGDDGPGVEPEVVIDGLGGG
jgi:hypothetical protein